MGWLRLGPESARLAGRKAGRCSRLSRLASAGQARTSTCRREDLQGSWGSILLADSLLLQKVPPKGGFGACLTMPRSTCTMPPTGFPLSPLLPSPPARYSIGNDPANWLAIHPENGIVTARDHLDRESVFVKNSTYVAIVLAVDDGDRGGGRQAVGWLLSLAGERIKSLFVALHWDDEGGAHVRSTWPGSAASRMHCHKEPQSFVWVGGVCVCVCGVLLWLAEGMMQGVLNWPLLAGGLSASSPEWHAPWVTFFFPRSMAP